MKVKKFLAVMAAAAVLSGLVSCSKKDSNSQNKEVAKKSSFYDTYGFDPDDYNDSDNDFWSEYDNSSSGRSGSSRNSDSYGSRRTNGSNGYGRQDDFGRQNGYGRQNDFGRQGGYGRQDDFGRQGGYGRQDNFGRNDNRRSDDYYDDYYDDEYSDNNYGNSYNSSYDDYYNDDDNYEYGSYYEDDDYSDYYSENDNDYYYNYDDDDSSDYSSEDEEYADNSDYSENSSNSSGRSSGNSRVASSDSEDTSSYTRSASLIDGALSTAKKNAKWTIMVYLCGSDLESGDSCATVDIQEMVKASLGSNINVVIETGGSKKWDSTYDVNADYLQRWIISDGNLVKVDQVKAASMGDPATLSDFISWAAKAYPAEKFVIDIWNHGSGSVYGVCFDEKYTLTDGNDDSLQIAELRKAFDLAGVKFEAFFFDTCLTATIEMANALAPYGKYMIASEEVVMSGCTAYKQWLSGLSSHPDISGADLGKTICKLYQSTMDQVGYGTECTMSTIDLSKIGAVQKAFETMASSMTKKTENVTVLRNLVRQGQKAIKYGSSSESEGYTNLVDLGDFADKASAEVPNESKALVDAIKKAIVYETHGSQKSSSTGLAVYYPVKYTGDTDLYAKNVNNMPYLMYLGAILDQWTAPVGVQKAITKKSIKPVRSKSYNVDFTTKIIEDSEGQANYTLNVTSGLDIVDSVNFNLYMLDEEAGEVIYLGCDNDVLADWKKGEFKDNFGGTWLSIGDNYIYAELMDEDKDENGNSVMNYYSIPVRCNGKETNIRATYSFEKNEYAITGLYDGNKRGAASKGYKKLKAGDKVVFLYSGVSLSDKSQIEYESDEIVYDPATFVLGDAELNAGTYYYEFEVTDIFGNVKNSDVQEMEYAEDGSITIIQDDSDDTAAAVSAASANNG